MNRLIRPVRHPLSGIAPVRRPRLFRLLATCLLFQLAYFYFAASGVAQTIEPIYFFGTNSTNPTGGNLILGPDGNLYGTTQEGTNGGGTVFKVTTSGAFTNLANFGDLPTGGYPSGGVTLGPEGNLYGTTTSGSAQTGGTVFQMTTNGVLTTLYVFSAPYVNADGARPSAPVILAPDGYLYGTTAYGGTNGNGTVFKMTTNGALTSLVSFDPLFLITNRTTNTTGANPAGGLTWGRMEVYTAQLLLVVWRDKGPFLG
jgi:uncharacterized repeat protein (TIGR03803 family)